jgi:hypothetical protein
MKAPLGIALMVLVASAPTTFAQLPDPRPDLVIAGIVTSKQRVGVDETFYHAVTDRNAGRTPCNFVNLTLKLPGEVDLDGASSESPPGLRLLTRTSPPRSMTRPRHGALPAQENGCVRILAPSDTKVACKGLDASRTSTENGSAAG